MALERSAIGWQQSISKALGCKLGQMTYQLEECIEKIERLRPAPITNLEQLDALPIGSLIRVLSHPERVPGEVLEKVGKEWLILDPSDRDDGEHTIPAANIIHFLGKAGIFVLFAPGGGE